jgi:photosystem II stability/assembly factor-like uncharacterized protein
MNNKIILLFLLSGLLFTGTTRAQWSTEKCPTNNNLNSIAFVGQKMGWIVGDKGTILLRTNNQWTKLQEPTSENLHSVCMIDKHNGWAVGDKGTILRFDGNNWLHFKSPTNKNLFSVSFNDADHGIAVGDYGTILLFQDGAWNPVESGSRARMLSVNFQTDNAWIGGGLECANVPLMQINMNARDKIPVNVLDSYSSITGISFSDKNNGWAVGSPGTILHFDGQRWKKVSTGKNHSSLKSVFFADDSSGISVGYGGTILTYKAGSWTKENSLLARDLKAGTINGDAYYAIGDSGTILTAKVLPLISSWTKEDSLSPEKLNPAQLNDQLQGDIRLFPNPCNDILNITMHDSYANKSVLISISNTQGKVLLQKELNDQMKLTRIQLNTSQLKSGTYYLHVVGASAIPVIKFIVLH